MKITSRFSIYCLIFHSVYFVAGSNNEPTIGLEAANNDPSHSLDIWVTAITDVWDRYDRSDHSSSDHGSGIRNDPQERDRMSDYERTMATEGRHESREKDDQTLSRSTGNDSQFRLHEPQVRKISHPGITFKRDALFDSRTSLPDWSATDFCDAIIAHNEIRFQEFNESRLWFSGNGRKIFIKRKLVDHVIRRYSLYKNPEFIQVIKTLPFVQESISRLNSDILQQKIITPNDDAVKAVRTLHKQFEKEEQYTEKRKAFNESGIPEIIADKARPSATNPMYSAVDKKIQQLWDTRHEAYEQMKNDPTGIVQEYTVPIETHNYLLNHGINLPVKHYYCGNAIQQQFHKEYLSIADVFAAIDACGKGAELMLDLMFGLIEEAAEYHYYSIAALASDYCNQALLIADTHLQTFYEHCPQLLRSAANAAYGIIKTEVVNHAKLIGAVSLGVYDALKSVSYMAARPIKTVQDMAVGIAHLGIILIKHGALIQEFLDLYEHWEPDAIKRAEKDRRAQELKSLIKNDYKTVYETVKNSGKGLDEFGVIRKGVAFGAECVILHKVQTKFVSVVKKTGMMRKISGRISSTAQNIKSSLINKDAARAAVALEGAVGLLETGGMTAQELALLNEAIGAAKVAETVAGAGAVGGDMVKTTATATTTVAEEAAECAAKAGETASRSLAPTVTRAIESSYKNGNCLVKMRHFFANMAEFEAVTAKFANVKLALKNVPSCMNNGVRFTEHSLKHFLGLEIKETINTISKMVKVKLEGFHFNQLKIMEQEGFIKVLRRTALAADVELVTIEFMGEAIKKTIFPSSWSMEKCCAKVVESMHKAIPRLEGGRYIYEGMTSCGVKIRTVVELWGDIVSSYPMPI